MNHTMNITGERLVEEPYRSSLGGYVIYLMHAASYRFAEKYCQGMRVLDLGCGSGYGAGAIAEHAKEVHAVDVSAEAIEFAGGGRRIGRSFPALHDPWAEDAA